ncbi:hypothetical protein EDB89DRAFT_2240784 [Lactarius sanguifluus]|nr:hypothetical protein EDB89DRAFT_2240784 [Lactarius sanguifluus]
MAPSRRMTREDRGAINNTLNNSAVFRRHSNNRFECLVCPRRSGKTLIMKASHAREHLSTGIHQRHLKPVSQDSFGPFSVNGPVVSDIAQEPLVSDEPAFHAPISVDHFPETYPMCTTGGSSGCVDRTPHPDDSWIDPMRSESDDDSNTTHQWTIQSERPPDSLTYDFSLGPDSVFSDEITGGEDHVDDLNIDLDAISVLDEVSIPIGTISPTCPTYPWPSFEFYLTDMLFSSPRLRFSEQQKKAVLNWASQLGARNVPSLYALSQFQERIKDIVGNSVTAVTSGAGDKLYIRDIPQMIAEDYANPITRFAIWDYPIDGNGGASQVFHGSKMLNISSTLVVPTVCVDDRIFFVDELLQDQDGTYFIPERFFYQLPEDANLSVYEPSVHDLWSLGRKVMRTDGGFIVSDEKSTMRVDKFSRTFLDIQSNGRELMCGFTDSSSEYGFHMPHPLRAKADGRMVYTVPVVLFMDDASANISKQWNKHIVVYLSNAGLPREMLDKEFCVKFVTSSPNASPMELMRAVRDSIDGALDSPVVMFDCKTKKEVLIIPYLIFTASDNPMHAEQTSQCGLNSNFFCRTCDVGGTKAHKKSDKGFGEIFEVGNIRDPAETKRVIEQQLELCILPGGSDKVDSAARNSGIKDAAVAPIIKYITAKGKALRNPSTLNTETSPNVAQPTIQDELDPMNTDGSYFDVPDLAATAEDVTVSCQQNVTVDRALEAGLAASTSLQDSARKLSEQEIQAKLREERDSLLRKGGINPLIGMPGFNMHLDTPTEILHTVLLGVVKYYWAQTIWQLKNRSKNMALFQTRLASVDWNGLNAPSTDAEYICQYHGSLIGKHFKGLAQVMPFLIYDIVHKDVLHAWNIIGVLLVLLWHTEIEDIECYLASLTQTIDDFLNITAKCAPSILILKPKFHFLVHLPAFIRRFGPAVLFSTERYESFNHVFRLSCIYSNRQAPSRDSCNTFAAQNRIKHIATGGYWRDNHTKMWVQAGQRILDYASAYDEALTWLGLPKESKLTPGATKLIYQRVASGRYTRSILPPTVPWKDTEASQVHSDLNTLTASTNLSVHRAESFIAQNGEDRVHVRDFVVFCQHIHSDSESQPLASVSQLGIGRVTEILVTADSDQAAHHAPRNSKASHITLEVYNFDEERHEIWGVPCIRPSEPKSVVVVAVKEIRCIANVQHDCYSCKCTGIRHNAVQQEREKTSKTRALVDHNPQARFVLNVHSVHNYKSILAVTPPSLRGLSTSVDTDIATLRMRAAQVIRGEVMNKDVVHPAGTDESTLGSLPFDRVRAKTRAAPQRDANVPFTGTLSSQSKSELSTMAAVLGIPATEKTRKQELMSQIRDYLDNNSDIRNSAQFGQLTWRSATRNKAPAVVPTPSSGTPDGVVAPHQPPSYVPLHPSFAAPQMPFFGLPAIGSHPWAINIVAACTSGTFVTYPKYIGSNTIGTAIVCRNLMQIYITRDQRQSRIMSITPGNKSTGLDPSVDGQII